MTARHSHEFTPNGAERLLDGQGGPAPLAGLLSAAAAPGRPHELHGEDAAVAAFERHYAYAPAPATGRRAMGRSLRGGLLTPKILALVAGLCGTGAVALAAATGTFSGPPAPAPSAARVSPGASSAFGPSPHSASGPVRGRQAPVPAGAPSSGASSPSSLTPGPAAGLTALCRDLAAATGQTQTQAGLERALASSAVPGVLGGARYASLTAAAGGAVGVPDYCALLLRLPVLPQPGELTTIPASVLAAALAGLPAGTLGEILPGLPGPVLSQVLDELPVPDLSATLTRLPAGALGRVLGAVPSSVASAVVARLPAATATRILAELPAGEAAGITAKLPAPLASRLPVG